MKNVLVMGINGTFGKHTAQALLARGFDVTAFLRDVNKRPGDLQQLNVTQGDANNLQSVRAACQGKDVIVYGINPPNYDWEGKALSYLDNVVKVAEEQKLTLVFPGNVYVFDPQQGPDFNEKAELRPITRKGEIRRAMEMRLRKASEADAQIIILRMGDFIARDSASSWLGHIIKSKHRSYRVVSPGDVHCVHTWAYVPDAARAVATLVEKRQQLTQFNNFHFPGYRISIAEIAEIVRSVSGQRVNLSRFPWWLAKMSAPFSTMFAGLVEMSYLWNQEVNLTDSRLMQLLGPDYHTTDIATALIESGLIETQVAHNLA